MSYGPTETLILIVVVAACVFLAVRYFRGTRPH